MTSAVRDRVLTLFDESEADRPLTRTERFERFHRDNPEVYRLFLQFARQAKAAGRERIGARLIGERIRWQTTVETSDPDFKVNDHFWPFYARLAMREHADLEGLFETRDRS